MADHNVRSRVYTKQEAYLLYPDIAQATIDGWYSTAASEGFGKHSMSYPHNDGVLAISGFELHRLYLKAVGKLWCIGQ